MRNKQNFEKIKYFEVYIGNSENKIGSYVKIEKKRP